MFNKPNDLIKPAATAEAILDDLDNKRLLKETSDHEDHSYNFAALREERFNASTWFETILDNITQ